MSNLDNKHAQASASGDIFHYGPEDFAGMRKAGQLAAQALDMLVERVKPGATTEALDELIFEFAMDHGALPATLNYRGYTKSSCISINEVVCHGIPSARCLESGDVANIDVTLIVDGWHGDASRMYGVGSISKRSAKLIDVTFESLMLAINAVRPGVPLRIIGDTIQRHARSNNFTVVRDFCGHGVGRHFHERPNILHYSVGNDGRRLPPGPDLKPGMIFTIEPMLNLGRADVVVLEDGWTAVTDDGKLSAQFEHTVGVTSEGCEIFTLSPAGLDKPPYELA